MDESRTRTLGVWGHELVTLLFKPSHLYLLFSGFKLGDMLFILVQQKQKYIIAGIKDVLHMCQAL